MDNPTNYLDDDRPAYEYMDELSGLRRQNDQLREMLAQIRQEVGGYRSRAEEAEVKLRQMEEARAGVTGVRLFFQRIDGAEGVTSHHYTINGTRFACHKRVDLRKYTLVKLSAAPKGLCERCAATLDLELRYNPYEEHAADPSYGRKKPTIEKQNAEFFKLKPDPNPLFTTHVYLIQSEGETRFKVGISTQPQKRLANLRHAGGRVLKVLFLSEACTDRGARSVEWEVRREFDRNRVAQEWYALSWQQVKRVKEIIALTVAEDRNKAAA